MQKKCRFKVNGILAALAMVLMVAAGADAGSSKVLYKFPGGNNAGHPYAGLILDRAGNLYGTTFEGGGSTCGYGDDPCGSVFMLTRNSNGSWTERVLHRFAGGSDGWSPYAGLTLDGAGNLYGTTVAGGGCRSFQAGCGTVFKLKPNSDGSWTESVLYSFCQLANCADGLEPYGGLILDGAGNLYGTTATGGSSGGGVVFKLTPKSGGGWTETVLQTLGGNHGGGPYAALIFDADGNLYGTTSAGGVRSGDVGTVFELVPNSFPPPADPKTERGWKHSTTQRTVHILDSRIAHRRNSSKWDTSRLLRYCYPHPPATHSACRVSLWLTA
jgi:uncharacterized repeat protein (TIGR03803 family)